MSQLSLRMSLIRNMSVRVLGISSCLETMKEQADKGRAVLEKGGEDTPTINLFHESSSK